MDRWSLAGRCIVVTGGTKGIGRAVVDCVLERGASTVVFCSRTKDDNNNLLPELQTRFPAASLHHVVCDVSTEEGRETLVSYCRTQVVSSSSSSSIHGLVNNVGTNIRKPILEQSPSEYHHILHTNLDSTYFLCRALYPLLSTTTDNNSSCSASIVNVASAAGVQSSGTGIAYAVSKAAVQHLSRTLACEWAHQSIRVNAVTPWMTETPLLQQQQQASTTTTAQAVEWTPLRRLATPQEIADPIVFLLLPAASYVTGQVWGIDGGLTAQGFAGPCTAAAGSTTSAANAASTM